MKLVHKPLFTAPETVNVDFADLKKWRLSKQKPPETVPVDKLEVHRAKKAVAMQDEMHRCQVSMALLTASKQGPEAPVTFLSSWLRDETEPQRV